MLKRIRQFLFPLLMTAFGGYMVLNHTGAADALLRVLAVVLIVLGGGGAVSQFTDKDSKKGTRALKGGIDVVFAAAGVFLLVSPFSLTDYIRYIFGGVIALSGLRGVFRTVRKKRPRPVQILSGVSVLLGIGLMLIRISPFSTFVIVSGIAFIFAGVASAAGQLRSKKSPSRETKRPETPTA